MGVTIRQVEIHEDDVRRADDHLFAVGPQGGSLPDFDLRVGGGERAADGFDMGRLVFEDEEGKGRGAHEVDFIYEESKRSNNFWQL